MLTWGQWWENKVLLSLVKTFWYLAHLSSGSWEQQALSSLLILVLWQVRYLFELVSSLHHVFSWFWMASRLAILSEICYFMYFSARDRLRKLFWPVPRYRPFFVTRISTCGIGFGNFSGPWRNTDLPLP